MCTVEEPSITRQVTKRHLAAAGRSLLTDRANKPSHLCYTWARPEQKRAKCGCKKQLLGVRKAGRPLGATIVKQERP